MVTEAKIGGKIIVVEKPPSKWSAIKWVFIGAIVIGLAILFAFTH